MSLLEARLLAIPMVGAMVLGFVELAHSHGADWALVRALVCFGIAAFIGTQILIAFYRQHGWPEDKE